MGLATLAAIVMLRRSASSGSRWARDAEVNLNSPVLSWLSILLVPLRLLLVLIGVLYGAVRSAFRSPGERWGGFILDVATTVRGSPIKLLQWLSTRPDIVGDEITSTLEQLQDQVPPPPRWWLHWQVRRELNRLGLPLNHLDEAPLGCGSVAVAMKGDVAEWGEVVLKIRRPGYVMATLADRWIYWAAAWISHPFVRFLNLPAQVDRFTKQVLLQADLEEEGRNLERFRDQLADQEHVSAPRAFAANERMVVMEFVPNAKPLGSEPEAHTEQARAVIRSLLQQLFYPDRLLHSDPHPGNILVPPEGPAMFIDTGLMEELTDEERDRLIHGLQGLIMKDSSALAEALITSAPIPPRFKPGERERFEATLEDFISNSGKHLADPKARLTKLVAQLFDVLREYRVGVDPNLVLANATLALAEGYVIYVPNLNIRNEIGMAIMKAKQMGKKAA